MEPVYKSQPMSTAPEDGTPLILYGGTLELRFSGKSRKILPTPNTGVIASSPFVGHGWYLDATFKSDRSTEEYVIEVRDPTHWVLAPVFIRATAHVNQ